MRALTLLSLFSLGLLLAVAPARAQTPAPAPDETLTKFNLNFPGGTHLPHDERQLLAWKYDGKRSTRDIAAALATSEKAVESRLARLRLKLKQMVLTALKHDSAT
jgi:hypothetical protein